MKPPFNFVGILRTAECSGVKAVIYPKDRACKLTAGVITASSAAVHYLDLIQVTNIAASIEKLKKAGYWIYGTDSNWGHALTYFDPASPVSLVMGNEDKGLFKRVRQLCDEAIYIHIKLNLGSMNVSVATGIILRHLLGK